MRRRSCLAPFLLASLLIHAGLMLLPRKFLDPVFPRTSIAVLSRSSHEVAVVPDFKVFTLEVEETSSSILVSEKLSQTSSLREISSSPNLSGGGETVKKGSSSEKPIYFPPTLKYITMPSVDDLAPGTISFVLEILVDENGKPVQVILPDSLHHRELRQRLQRSAMLFRFEPATRGGIPVAAWVRLPISLKAGGGD